MIKLILFILFFLWVIKEPYTYRESVREKILAKDPAVSLPVKEKEKTQEFLDAVQRYKAGDPRRTEAMSELAYARWQQLLFADAERLYKVILTENKPQRGYDQNTVKTMLNLAAVLDAQQKFDEAISYYGRVLDYDKKHMPENDTSVARDYNNLGLSTYLKASSKERGSERIKVLHLADDYYKQSLQIYKIQPLESHALSVVLYNRYLALRDLGNFSEAELVKNQSKAIDDQIANLCRIPY